MNWGILGCANIAITSVIPAILRSDANAKIIVSSRSLQKAEEVSGRYNCNFVTGYEKLLEIEELDAIYIPLPTGLHYEWVLKALKLGKHVLVEKSAAMTFNEANEMVELARRKNLALVENFQFQHHSQHKVVKSIIKEKRLGELRCFRSSFGFPPFGGDNNIRYKKELGGGALLDAGAYTLKAASFILEKDFEVKSSFLANNDKYKVDWFGGAFLIDEKKEIFVETAFGFDNYYQCNYEIWFSKGKVTATRAYTAKLDYAPELIIEEDGNVETVRLEKDDHFLNMINYFKTIILNHDFEKEYSNLLKQALLIELVKLNS
ncbi:Gfo/Idh/MocA family oxidoreductase [Flavivirga abyssicola]|uniref:Gfo/Idh/MocA family protein n=1 Tax=Flavivirga abyssicola TaxID=3063533 RepID=UPI0026E01DFD|nr:Gfo/Idh/MocA family oxidoreductase [Flavivirga sp. MEBiC07777]WVK14799.1 Gfo/Idh/MocA family oxidoreductase [Flavivirga sp. MEBiC07777]